MAELESRAGEIGEETRKHKEDQLQLKDAHVQLKEALESRIRSVRKEQEQELKEALESTIRSVRKEHKQEQEELKADQERRGDSIRQQNMKRK